MIRIVAAIGMVGVGCGCYGVAFVGWSHRAAALELKERQPPIVRDSETKPKKVDDRQSGVRLASDSRTVEF